MVRECFKTNTGIMFEAASLKEIGLDPATLYPFVLPRPPPCCVKQMEHQVRRRPTNPIPVRLHAALKNKRHAEIHARHVISPAQFLGSEEEEELQDALSPAYDQLKLQRFWWLGEIIPLSLKYQRGNNEWVTRFGCVNQMWYSFRWDIQDSGWSDCNLAQPRFIPKQVQHGVKIHRSVKLRMDAEHENEKKKGKKYRPKADLRVEPTWVD